MTNSPLALSLARLPRAVGSTMHVDVEWVTPDDLGTPAMGVRPGITLPVSFDVTSVDDGVLVRLSTSVELVGQCVRCLDEVRDHHDIASDEVYFEPGSPVFTQVDEDEEDIDADDLFEIGEHDTIDVETQLRDAIVTLVDPRPLCRPDCAGLCDVCGEKWDNLPEDHSHFVVDPRLASLASLLESTEE